MAVIYPLLVNAADNKQCDQPCVCESASPQDNH